MVAVAVFSALPATAAEFKLAALDGAAYDHFGFSVAISGESAIVGSRWDGGSILISKLNKISDYY